MQFVLPLVTLESCTSTPTLCRERGDRIGCQEGWVQRCLSDASPSPHFWAARRKEEIANGCSANLLNPECSRALGLVLWQRRGHILPTPLPPDMRTFGDVGSVWFSLYLVWRFVLEEAVGRKPGEVGSFPGHELLRAQAQKGIPSSGDRPEL